MSIWATLVAFDADEDTGATRPYHGSHVMPSTTDTDGPVLDLAAIPADVEAERLGVDVLDDSVLDLYLPWLRVSMGGGATSEQDDLRQLAESIFFKSYPAGLRIVADTVKALRAHPHLAARLLPIDAVIDRVQVEALIDVLGVWLDRQKTETRSGL